MPGRDLNLGKNAERKIKSWLNKGDGKSSFDRIPDQMTGFYGSSNICDFIYFKTPSLYYIESKATWHDRFDFSMLSQIQFDGLKEKSQIDGCYGLVIVLFATYKRAFIFDIRDIASGKDHGIKSLNIKKIDKWDVNFAEIQTKPSRKQLLDYDDDLERLISVIKEGQDLNES